MPWWRWYSFHESDCDDSLHTGANTVPDIVAVAVPDIVADAVADIVADAVPWCDWERVFLDHVAIVSLAYWERRW